MSEKSVDWNAMTLDERMAIYNDPKGYVGLTDDDRRRAFYGSVIIEHVEWLAKNRMNSFESDRLWHNMLNKCESLNKELAEEWRQAFPKISEVFALSPLPEAVRGFEQFLRTSEFNRDEQESARSLRGNIVKRFPPFIPMKDMEGLLSDKTWLVETIEDATKYLGLAHGRVGGHIIVCRPVQQPPAPRDQNREMGIIGDSREEVASKAS